MGAAGVSSALAGGSFAAGALGASSIGLVATAGSGFVSGAIIGASGGLVGGFTTGFGNGLVEGKGIGDCFKNGIRDGALGAITGGIVGGVAGGIKALSGDANFWSGMKTLDTSQGVGAHSSEAQSLVNKGSAKGWYMGKYQNVNVYETSGLGSGKYSGGLTLPPKSILIGKGAFGLIGNNDQINDLMMHEFGHILESRQSFVGLEGFYKVIAPESLLTSRMSYANSYWTETWANHLSENYFGKCFLNSVKYPSSNLSGDNYLKFFNYK